VRTWPFIYDETDEEPPGRNTFQIDYDALGSHDFTLLDSKLTIRHADGQVSKYDVLERTTNTDENGIPTTFLKLKAT